SANRSASRINAAAMASKCSIGTSFIRAKFGTHKPCFSASRRRNASGSISMERIPRKAPNRKKRRATRPGKEACRELCNFPMPLASYGLQRPPCNAVQRRRFLLEGRNLRELGGLPARPHENVSPTLRGHALGYTACFLMATLPRFVLVDLQQYPE